MKKYVYTVIGMKSIEDAERVIGAFLGTLGDGIVCDADIENMRVSLSTRPKKHLEQALRVLLSGYGYELILPAGAERFAFEGEKKATLCVPLWLTCTLVCVGAVLSAFITFILTGGYI